MIKNKFGENYTYYYPLFYLKFKKYNEIYIQFNHHKNERHT